MNNKLYRTEAIEYKRHHWRGKALLLAGLPAWLIVLLSTLFLIALIVAVIFCKFTQRIDVKGEVITLLILLMCFRHNRDSSSSSMLK